ncbi:MAG: hypothetical protein CMD54_04745 [Gammaproteobacteria bacterium]|nr:hypothetical protein [Gammaproteobacteria bacterium]HAN79964.1 hypothetical protein [Gammaproteobacteria bacterium]
MDVVLVGLGRIGKLVARRLLLDNSAGLNWVGAVELTRDPELFSYTLNYDSTYGTLDTRVEHTTDSLRIQGLNDVPLFDDLTLAIEETSPDLVVDCSGSQKSAEILLSRERTRFKRHLFAQPLDLIKRDNDSRVWVYGVNDSDFDRLKIPRNIINPGCLNNCLIPLIACLNEQNKIMKGSFVSVHSVTNTQPTLDRAKRSPRWSRASHSNLVPAAHDSMSLVDHFFPELKNKLVGRTVRAPVNHTSYITCNFELNERTDTDSLLRCLTSTKIIPTVFGVDQEPLVSSDYLTDPRSCVVDGTSIRVIDGSTALLSAWYNNEYAFACRMVDIANKISQAS